MTTWRKALLAVVLFPALAHAEPAVIAVEFKLTDIDYKPLPGVPVRIAVSGQDWQAPDAGQRFVTDGNGAAQFTVNADIDQRTRTQITGFISSRPVKADHLLIAAELERPLPLGGVDTSFRWLMVTHVDCYVGQGQCEGGHIDELYARDDTGRFARKLEMRQDVLPLAKRTDPDSQAAFYGAGYEPWDWLLTRDEDDPSHTHWHLKLAYKRFPKPVYYK